MLPLLTISLHGTAIIIGIIVLRAVFINRLPKTVFITLWQAALLRLLLPFELKLSSAQMDVTTAAPDYSGTFTVIPSIQQSTVTEIPTSGQVGHRVDIIAVIWVAGMVLCAVYLLWNYFRCRREFSVAEKLTDPFVSAWQNEHRAKRVITVKVTDAVSSPMTYGLFRPVILLPRNIDIKNTSQLKFILMHEYVHIKKLDGLLKAVSSAAVCVHWFNPFVWAMHELLCRDIELRCDECVLKELGIDSRADYARAIIDLEELRSGFLPIGLSFGGNETKERIVAIMKYKDKSPISAIVLIIVLTAVIAITAVACAAGNNADEIGKEMLNNSSTEEKIYLAADEFDLKAGDAVVLHYERDLSSPEYYSEDETVEFGYILNGERFPLSTFDGGDPTKPLDVQGGKADSVGIRFEASKDGHYSFYVSYIGEAEFKLISLEAQETGEVIAAAGSDGGTPGNSDMQDIQDHIHDILSNIMTINAGGSPNVCQKIIKDGDVVSDGTLYLEKGSKAAIVIDLGEYDGFVTDEEFDSYVNDMFTYGFSVGGTDYYIPANAGVMYDHNKVIIDTLFIAPEDGEYSFFCLNNTEYNIGVMDFFVVLQGSDDPEDIVNITTSDGYETGTGGASINFDSWLPRRLYANGEPDVCDEIYKDYAIVGNEASADIYLKAGTKAVAVIDLGKASLDDDFVCQIIEPDAPIIPNVFDPDLNQVYSGYDYYNEGYDGDAHFTEKRSALLDDRVFYYVNGRAYIGSSFIAPKDGIYTFYAVNKGGDDMQYAHQYVVLQGSDDGENEVTFHFDDFSTTTRKIDIRAWNTIPN